MVEDTLTSLWLMMGMMMDYASRELLREQRLVKHG